MKNLNFILLAIVIWSGAEVQSQDVKEMDYAQLEPYLNKTTDTVYVVNFWATWCKPCVEELPMFLSVASEMRKEKVKFIFVSLDFPKQKETRVIPFVEKYNISDLVILLNDPNSNYWINKVNSTWSGGLPATLIYKSTDKSFFEEQLEYEQLIKEIKLKQ